jgi:TetR/AcrR family transcriptional regulator, cholesterol catabolism regulator
LSDYIDSIFFLDILETKLLEIVSMQDYRIVIKARQLFFTLGFKLVTMDLLAKNLSISKKTIYKHYKTKDDLVLTVIELMHKKINMKISKIIDDSNKNFPEKLTKIFFMIANKLSQINPLFLAELKEKREDIYHKIESLRHESILNSMTKLIDKGKEEGYVRENVETLVFTESYLVLIEHFINPEYLISSKMNADKIYKQIVKIIFIGIIKSDHDNEFKKLIELD